MGFTYREPIKFFPLFFLLNCENMILSVQWMEFELINVADWIPAQ